LTAPSSLNRPIKTMADKMAAASRIGEDENAGRFRGLDVSFQ
jgi:hypothetical protein